MIDVTTLGDIRQASLLERRSIREIARRTQVSRNTVRKYLRDLGAEPRYPERARRSKLDTFADRLTLWLEREASRPRADRMTVKRMHLELLTQGFDGSYACVAAFARDWAATRHDSLSVPFEAHP